MSDDPWLTKYLTKNYARFQGRGYNIGNYTYGVPNVLHHISYQVTLTIGKFCAIAENVTIIMGGEHNPDSISVYGFNKTFTGRCQDGMASKGDVTIGNDVWICFGATILSGVTIGDGAVIGACAVVIKDVPPYAIVAGNPAKIVRMRFPPEVFNQLIKLKWWDWSEERIKAELPTLLERAKHGRI